MTAQDVAQSILIATGAGAFVGGIAGGVAWLVLAVVHRGHR